MKRCALQSTNLKITPFFTVCNEMLTESINSFQQKGLNLKNRGMFKSFHSDKNTAQPATRVNEGLLFFSAV